MGPRAAGWEGVALEAEGCPLALGPWGPWDHRVIQMGPGQTGPGLIDSQMALALPIASFRSNLIAIELAICRGL